MTLPQLLRALLRYDVDITYRSPRFHGPDAVRWNVAVYDWDGDVALRTRQPTLLKALRETVGRLSK